MSTTFLKKYKVLGKVGEGSFSEVLKCQDRETGALYAAKRLKKIKETITDALKTPEVVAMRKLKHHPNILHMIESHFDPLPGKVTMIFELMEMSMYDLMKTRKRCLPETRVKNYLYQVLKGVDHLHRHGLFHRDIKPENILLKSDLVKLADLGSVRGIFCRPPYTEYISTRWYRSPECLLTTGYYGPKMDVWATGCVFFELLTLKPLFPGANEMDQVAKIHNILGTPNARLIAKFRRHKSRNCEYYFPMRTGSGIFQLLPNVSESGRDILKHMLVYDPEMRPNVRRLLEHRYFNDLRDMEATPRRRSWSVTPASTQVNSDWRNPALLSYITSEKRKKSKRTSTNRRLSDPQKLPRVVSSPSQRPVLQPKPSVSNAKHRQMEKTWGVQANVLGPKQSQNISPKRVKAEQFLMSDNCMRLPHILGKTSPVKRVVPPARTITSLPLLESRVNIGKSSTSASFLNLPPIVVRRQEPQPTLPGARTSQLSKSYVSPRHLHKLATIEEQP